MTTRFNRVPLIRGVDRMSRMEIDMPGARSAPVRVRRAGVEDADALVRLRGVMLASMGVDVGPEDAAWREAARLWFARRLAEPGEFAAYVVDDPELGVVSNAVGACDRHAPGPGNPSGVHGHVSNVCTDQRRLRLGYARACLEALIGWFESDTEVRMINLNATPDGGGLYRALGFDAPRNPALQLRLTGHIPPAPSVSTVTASGGGR